MIIAIDGLSASGKGCLRLHLATYLGLPHLDTGRLYRAVGLACSDAGIGPENAAACADVASTINADAYADSRLSSPAAAEAASRIAELAPVRAALLARQRSFAHQEKGAVLDGRDIGSIVLPEADVKFWLTASSPVRAARRWQQLLHMGTPYDGDIGSLARELRLRDVRDAERQTAPAIPAADAIVIDTSEMSEEETLAQALDAVAQI